MIEIQNQAFSVGVLPSVGGSLCFFKYNGIDILRLVPSDETDANQTALFPMVPYASFIQNGTFPYFGITRHVPKNSSINRFPIHGDLWCSNMIVEKESEDSVLLSYIHDKKEGFPFSYKAEVGYSLTAEKLVIELDGDQHAETKDYDNKRTAFIESQGYHVIRIANSELTAKGMKTIIDTLRMCINEHLDFNEFFVSRWE